MKEQTGKRKEWVKNAAIIFLAVMLVLTFFSNTIMNYSLPQVSAQYVTSGTINEKIRGSGALKAAQEYEVKLSETRDIKSVAVKTGDTVKAGDVLMYLEDTESTELTQAEDKLDELKLDYQKALLDCTPEYSTDNIEIETKKREVEKAKEALAEVGTNQEKLEAAKEAVKEAQKEVDALTEQQKEVEEKMSTISADKADYSELSDEYYKKLTAAEDKITKAEEKKNECEKDLKDIETKMSSGTTAETLSSLRKTIESYQIELAELSYKLSNETDPEKIIEISNQITKKELDVKYAQENLNAAVGKTEMSYSTEYYSVKYKYDQANSAYKAAKKALEDLKRSIKGTYKSEQDIIKDKLTEANYVLNDAKTALEEAKTKYNLTEDTAQQAVDKAQAELEGLIAKYGLATGKAKLELEAKKADVSKQQETVNKLKAKTTDSKVTAKMGGVIKSLSVVAGDKAEADKVLAVIEVNEKGYQLSFTITAAQAKKVKVGDVGEVSYYWGSDIKATVSSIKPDTTDPANKKILTFDITGDVTAGQTLNIELGGTSQNYETIVPKSAIRKDSDGQFVLVVTSKSSPLGNRYYAERYPVQVVASDDVQSAVTGLYGNEYVITTSNKLVEAGMQVRMQDAS